MAGGRRVVYFDCFAGASGDMILGSLLDLGLDLTALRGELDKLALHEYQLEAVKTSKAGFSATKFAVLDLKGRPYDSGVNDHGHPGTHGHGRYLDDILNIIGSSQLSPVIKEQSGRIFHRLAEAEGKIHGTEPAKVHFHEVGAVDAIVDIVGAVTALHLLQVDKVVVSPLPLGRGFVRCQHGRIPVPAPAVMELLQDMQAYGSEHDGETVTPTGAAILSTLAEGSGPMPPLKVIATGYGAGSRDFGVPNLLRAVLGQERGGTLQGLACPVDSVSEIEANVDDMNPEFFDYIFNSLFKHGALDVFLVPIQMKKNRPAVTLRVLCREEDLTRLVRLLFLETSTIGVRVNQTQRFCLERKIVSVQTEYGEIRLKQALLEGEEVNLAPEYEDCKQKAELNGVSLKLVYNAALRQAGAIKQSGERN